MTDQDRAHMAHALQLAARGLGRVWPNPAVGCVIVNGSRIIGRGWTQPGGRPHAETRALDQAGHAARGAVAYVTLEPCAHHGQTAPCAEALIAAGVSRVVTALTDPDDRVAGRGHALLRAAGIAVTENVLSKEAAFLNAGFLKRVTKCQPLITLKLATTLDGRIATQSGESRWITGPDARRSVHALRMQHDAVLVGSGTALADDPDLTVREIGAPHQPLRILVDSQLRHSADSRLGRSAGASPVLICHAPDAANPAQWQAVGAETLACKTRGTHLDLVDMMEKLASRGLTRIFCEGGAGLAAALIREGLVDRLVLFSAGVLIGAEGQGALGPLGLERLADAPRLRLLSQARVGADVVSHWAFD